MGFLDRKKLLEKEKLEVVQVDLGNGDFVYVRQMMAYERDKFEQSLRKEVKNAKGGTDFELALDNYRAKLAVCTVSDDKGVLIFEPGDYLTLSKSMGSARMEKIVIEAQNLNAITEEDKEKLVKNSDAGQAGSSSSVSVKS